MNRMPDGWDYLIVTASNETQAEAYEIQLDLRRRMGHLTQVRHSLVVADPEGKRIGSGGSTLYCLNRIIGLECTERNSGGSAEEILRRLRILIIHAGGDSKRLPAYGPCGKIFVPVPGESSSALGTTLFDLLAPAFMALPGGQHGEGQVIVTSGDALNRFDSSSVDFSAPGMTALGCYASPEEASRHGVFCTSASGVARLYLQKPSIAEQKRTGAMNRSGKTALDIGVMSFDAVAAAAFLRAFDLSDGAMMHAVLANGVDLYREICCAMGSESTPEHYIQSARASGAKWSDAELRGFFDTLNAVPLHVRMLPRCSFLHFGSTRQLVDSGLALVQQETGAAPAGNCLLVDNEIRDGGGVNGSNSWVEGCTIGAQLTLGGGNVVVGAAIDAPLEFPAEACLDTLLGKNPQGEERWFVRCYGARDAFKDSVANGALFCGIPVLDWLAKTGAAPEDVWDASIPVDKRSLWDARVFPAGSGHDSYRNWLWMFDAGHATHAQKQAFFAAERYSAAEIALLADQTAFHERRARIRAKTLLRSIPRLFQVESRFCADDLAFALAHTAEPSVCVAGILAHAHVHVAEEGAGGMENFVLCRIIHSLASALQQIAARESRLLCDLLPELAAQLTTEVAAWLESLGLAPRPEVTVGAWTTRLKALTFERLSDAILASSLRAVVRPHNSLRDGETIWGRGPARIELGGGWTDTPPYTLEFGGDVANVAVNLNGQPPIHCYCRVTEEPVIRLGSIDGGRHLEITTLAELLDYRRPEDRFALAKAALAISGFDPEMADWRKGITLAEMLKEFGGGIELTTLVGIPKGSGLGTSSILGAVIMAVLRRMMGRKPDQRELFHDVLRLEQALTTGGGWQDQIGGGVGGSKITHTAPGFFPDPRIHYVPDDLIDPKANGGATLLYYTGITRLAKNILQQVVGGYLNRNRAIMAALAEEHLVASCVADAMARKDAAAFGHSVNAAWELQKRLCGDVTNDEIESLLSRVRPHVHGMRISGAGSGGFLLMICKSPRDAALVREMLEREPLNERSRFFDFEINHAGLEVTTC